MPGPFDSLRGRLARMWHDHPGRWWRALSPDAHSTLDWPRFFSWRGAGKFIACWLIAICLPIIDPFEAEHSTRLFVFMDILFMDPVLGSFEPLGDAMTHYEGSRTPLLLVGRPTSDTQDRAALEAQKVPEDFATALSDHSQTASGDVWDSEQKLAMVEPVLAPITRKDVVVRSYEIGAPPGAQDGQRSAAVRLYEIATGRPFDMSGPRMELFWDLSVPPTNARWLGCSEEAATTNLALRAWKLVSAPSELKQPCPTVQTVPLIELLLPDRDPDAQRMIDGKLVLFGADVVGGDVYPTAINDMLPGVYIHAMAVKNLLAFGDRYLRTSVNAWPLPVRMTWFFEATLVALVVLWLGGSRRGHAHDVPLIDKILKMLLHDGKLGLVTMVLALVLSAILMALLSLVPLNWLSVGALAALTREIIHWFPIDDWIVRRLAGFRAMAKPKAPLGSAGSQ